MADFDNAVILVTGAASGIGAAVATRLAAGGARKLILADLDEDRLRDFGFSLACERQMMIGDVADPQLWADADLTGLTHAVVNAGIGAGGVIESLTFDDWRRVMAVNLDGAFLTLQAAMRAIRSGGSGGAIVLTASAAGLKAEPGIAAYGASKAAVIHLARIAAREGAGAGIRVNAVAPGGVETPIWRGHAAIQRDGRGARRGRGVPRHGGGGDSARPLRPARGDWRADRLPAVRQGRLHDRRLPGQRWRLFALASFSFCSRSPAAAGRRSERRHRRRPRPPLPGIARRAASKARASPSAATNSRRHDLELIVDDGGAPLRGFAALETALGARRARLLFAMNAGMYDEDGRPIGLHVEAGRRRHRVNLRSGPGNFHLKPNGVFAVAADGRVAIVRSERLGDLPFAPHWATQSGPMLVVDGRLHPRFQANGPSLNIRNGVGVADSGTAWFAISDEPVSFGRFARLFRDALDCRNALFFDGTVSSLWDPAAGRRDQGHEIGPMVAVFRKAEDRE